MKNLLTTAALVAAFTLSSASLHAAGIAEPATTFYGKVLGTADLQPFLITEGRLAWTIRRADGSDVTLHAKLFAWNKGTFSYRLDVPHSALSLGLAPDGGDVPLALYEQTHRHLAVLLDGEPVTLLGPAGEAFTSAQILRSSTYRLDLGVNRHALDTSGDGIPDWWCDLYGLDKQVNNASSVLTPGGLTVAQCYALGLDPNADHTIPALLTEETIVYAHGSTALILEVFDLDTAPSNLVYTAAALPFGTLALLGADGTLGALEPGATFTQEDVLAARLIYQHAAEASDPGLFAFTLSDGAHEPIEGAVRLLLYEPAINEVSPRSDLYQLASAGFVVGEGAAIDASGAAVSYALAGNTLTGGAADDVLTDTPADGGDFVWAGGAGADRFIITDFTAHTVTITDFSVAEGDILDITAFAPASGTLADNVTLNGSTLTFGAGLVVTLEGLAGEDLYTLVSCGAVLTGLPLPPRVSVVATTPTASRNGPVPGVFTLYREGDAAQAVTVNISVSGSAQNGVDYEAIPASAVVVPAGASSIEIAVTPYTTGASSAVVAALQVLAGNGYTLGAAQAANVTIEPRKTEVGVEVIVSNVASLGDGESAYVLLWRDTEGASLVVENQIGGDATRGTDYQTYNFDTGLAVNPALAIFGANETEKLYEVSVLPTANFANGSKRLTLAPAVTTRYAIAPAKASAEVTLIDRWETYENWLAQGGVMMGFAPMPDSGMLFKRYAYGSDPQGSDASGFPRPFMLADGMTVRVRQPVGRLGVSYSLSGFTDLGDPAGSAVGFTEVTAPKGQPGGPDWRYYRLNSNGERGFIRVEVQ
ncbi:MAG: hypothetical protein FWG50_00470 [Kiritimatiellaeota bacterium]|nr:hypothetical protein [Kiritimatiellota bacterium]